MQTHSADWQEIETLYNQRVKADFPGPEVRPLATFRDMYRRGIYGALCVTEKDALLAYVLYVAPPGSGIVFIDHFAVVPGRREGGVGSETLRLLVRRFPDRRILLEVEEPDEARDAAERALRARRIRFYERAGYRVTAVRVRVFGNALRILTSGGSDAESRADIGQIYDAMFPAPELRRQLTVL